MTAEETGNGLEHAGTAAGLECEGAPAGGRAPRRGPILLLAFALVVAVVAGFALGSQNGSPPANPTGGQGDPFVLLETALASNMPAYVLMHSAT